MLISAEVRDVFDLSSLEAEDEAPGQVQAAAFFAPAAVVINHVVAILSHNERLRLEVGLAKLDEESENFINTAFSPGEGVVTRNSPSDVICHHFAHVRHILGCVGGKEGLNFL